MKNPDEDYAYGTWKQKQIDESRKSQQLISSGLVGTERCPQRYARYDPAPGILFEEQKEAIYKPITKLEWAYAIIWASAVGYALWLVGG